MSKRQPDADRWEYKIVRVGKAEGEGVQKLNELGAEGWRVVQAASTTSPGIFVVMERRLVTPR